MKEKTHALVKFIYPKYYYYIIVCNFFVPHFSIRIFPSASVIHRYPVLVLQTPSPARVSVLDATPAITSVLSLLRGTKSFFNP